MAVLWLRQYFDGIRKYLLSQRMNEISRWMKFADISDEKTSYEWKRSGNHSHKYEYWYHNLCFLIWLFRFPCWLRNIH